jgi:hypothetical protein
MRLITSRATFFHKRVFPLIWFGGLAVFALTAVVGRGPLFVLVPVSVMGVFGFVFMKKLVFDLVDQVWDEGADLLIRNRGREVRVQFAEIVNISYSPLNPQRATLSLRHPTALGREIAFVPPTVWIPFARSPVIDDLIQRVDAARLSAGRLR